MLDFCKDELFVLEFTILQKLGGCPCKELFVLFLLITDSTLSFLMYIVR